MRRLATNLCGILAAFMLFCGAAHAQKRVALVIGNGAYTNASKLTNPPNDATAVAQMFRDSGFDVVEARTDLGNLEFKRVVREFTAVARDSDVAVMYFAGHGVEVNGTNYLIPVDAKLASDFDVDDESLSLDRLLRALEPAKRLRLVILDACRDNPFARNMQRTVATRSIVSGLAKVEPATSDTLIAFATKPGQTADDGIASNSPFTAALLKNLTVPGRDIRIALGFTRDDVLKATGGRQEPFVSGSLGGATVALVPEKEKVAAAQPTREIAVQPAIQAPSGADPRRDYEFAERVGTREAWDSFLSVHPSGFYSDLARAQRDKLTARIEPKAPPAPAVPAVPLVSQNPPPERKPANIAVLPPPGAEKPAAPVAPPAERKPANIAVLQPPGSPQTPPAEPQESDGKPDLAAVTRELQNELRRVGCDGGRVDGNWSSRWREAMGDFNQKAGTRFEVKVASVDALDGVKGQRGRICPLICGRNQHVEGDSCVANPVEKKPPPRKEASRPPEPSPRERAREKARERAQQERVRERSQERREVSRPARASCPPGQSPFTQGGRMCCESTPDRGTPRIFCP